MKNKSIKIGLIGLLAVVMMSVSHFKISNEMSYFEPCSIRNTAFKGGESLTYKLYYNWGYLWVSAGEIKFTVEDIGTQYHVKAVGETYKSYDWVFKVRDTYEAFLDKETLLPDMSIRQVAEGKYRLYDKLVFDRVNGKVTSYRGDYEADAKPTVYDDTDKCISEMVSIVYFIRNVGFDQFDSGAEFPINIFMDKEPWELSVKYQGLEEKSIKGHGKKKLRKFTPQVITGDIFEEGAEINVYVSEDENQIPYLIESPLSVGIVKAVLKDHSGLAH